MSSKTISVVALCVAFASLGLSIAAFSVACRETVMEQSIREQKNAREAYKLAEKALNGK